MPHAITPSDTVANTKPYKHLYVGGTGSIAFKNLAGETVTLTAVPVGRIPNFAPSRILATGTTATNLVGM
jgi:hypothetical protein